MRKNHRKLPSRAKKPLAQEVHFLLEWSGGKDVYICGDFNGWAPAGLRMIKKGDAGPWEKRLVLTPGRYEYKFHVDGRWVHDPHARHNIANAHGSLNSVVEVVP